MNALTTPSNWQRVRLGDMTTSFTKQTGFDYSASIKPTLIKEQLPNYIPFIQNKDFLGHYINYKTDYFIPNEIAIRFPQILLNEKCLLISISGAIGNVAVFNHSQDAFIGGAIAVLKFKEKKSLDFVMHFLMSASGQKLLLNSVKSSSHKNLTIADLRDLLIPLPPLNEQIAIANILSDADRYLYSLDALILKKESVKKALSFELLSQRKRLKGFNQAWQRVRLGDMTTSFTKQTGFDYSASIKPTLIKEQLPNYIPFIQNKDFLGHYINYKTDYFIPNEIAIRFPQILLNEKCLLISISGAIGNVAVFNHSQDAFIGGAIAVLKFKEKKSLDFVMHFLMSASGQKLLLNSVKSSSHKNLTIADLRDLLIPLPPLNEQIAIANILSALDHEIISLKNKKRQFENIKKALNHDLMSAKIRVLNK
ncbi:restriction endonuclease subunit S [Helicobacter pylori]|nr:restriction endonuclease subunit S [Helicobacter pylori]